MATCRGVDVSAYQSGQDWAAHKRDGVVFAFAKASEGQHSRDSRFAAHIRGIKAAGLVPGAYHFGWPNQSADAEAANYIAAVKPYAGRGFVHWLDLERYSDGRNYRGRSAAQIQAWVARWLLLVRDAFPGQRVGVYTSGSDLQAGHVPAGVPLWYPAYPWGPADFTRAEGAAQPRPSGRTPLFWQFTSQPIDRSICYLTAADLRTWAAGTTPTTSKETALVADASDVKTLFKTDNVLDSPDKDKDPAGNKFWTAESYLRYGYLQDRETNKLVKTLAAKIDAQQATIDKLVDAIAAGPAADLQALKQEIRSAIESVTVHLDVPDAS